ncbi:hypothetical protein [Mucilaginibacter ginsenosidivorans]|uniref:DUF2214 family protein n=1 Tax=Mucilaginibacter ginsenosidivorans TaxID=398053 RepID=A0A5B8V0R0_9SPHI|nr:hypothetical protein [Mucilaginibacter ginsenosidivorans]QEC64934.1 hypothetical protein FRZ54_20965 [Mucilaginibacter ginsenosidivorans]
MDSSTLLQTLLVLHISGFVTLAGTVVADTAIYSRVKKQLLTDKGKASVMLDGSGLFPVLIRISAIVVIVTGMGMVGIVHAFTDMLWFRLKMLMVLGIIINGAIVGRSLMAKLRSLLSADIANNAETERIQRKLNVMYIVQLILFLIVFTLSVFKF